MRLILLTFLTSLCAAQANAAALNFCWIGANGYTMTGNFEVPDHLMSNAVLTEHHVTRFKITGYHNGLRLGSWTSAQQTSGTTWHLRFDPIGMSLLTGGKFAATHSQGWNANGDVSDCGNPGFGFNSGDYAQDICLDGQFVAASSIAPDTPIIVTTAPVTPTCSTGNVLSKR